MTQTSDQPGCELFAAAIAKRQSGTLDGVASRALDEHLFDCAACRDLAARTAATAATEAAHARANQLPIDQADLRAKLDKRVRQMHRSSRLLPWIFGITVAPLLVFGLVLDEVGAVIASIAVAIFFMAIIALHRRNVARYLAKLDAAPDVIAAYRTDLDARTKNVRWLVPIYAITIALNTFGLRDAFRQALGDDTPDAWLHFGSCAAPPLLFLLSLIMIVRARRKAEREREALNPATARAINRHA